MTPSDPLLCDDLARQVRDLGEAAGLPHIAASADISSTEPLRDAQGRPLAESVFRWVDPKLEYWKDRSFALRAPFVDALRHSAEPFYFHEGRFGSWRPTPQLAHLDASGAARFGVGAAILVPAHLPGGVVGGVVWASAEGRPDFPQVYDRWAKDLQFLAVRFLSLCHERAGKASRPANLTRREAQCLKWAALGKTDVEIAQIVHISMTTVRFHIRNAAAKLGVRGRSQAIHRAATLGYTGALAVEAVARRE